jgi:hypothetical protein
MILQNKKQKRIWLISFLFAITIAILAFQILIQISNHQEIVHLENKENAKKIVTQKNLDLISIPKCDSLISYRRHFYESCVINKIITNKTHDEFWTFTENSIRKNTFLEIFDDAAFRNFLNNYADYDDWWYLGHRNELGQWISLHQGHNGLNYEVNNFKLFTMGTSVYNCASEQTMNEIEALWLLEQKEFELAMAENNLQRIYYDYMALITSVLGIICLLGYTYAFVKKRQDLKLNKEG